MKLGVHFVQQEAQQRARILARMRDRRRHDLAAEVGQFSYVPVVRIERVS